MRKGIILLFGILLLFCGCDGRAEELEHSAIVRALAIDRADVGYRVSAYLAGAEEGSIVGAEGKTVAQCMLRLNTVTERRIFLGQLRVIAISDALRDTREVLLYLYGAEDVRSAARVMTVRGDAEAVFGCRGLYRDPAEDLEKTLENAEEHANFPRVTLHGCVNAMAADAGTCILPVARAEGEILRVTEGCLYRDFRILQTLSEDALAGSAVFAEKDRVFLPVGQDVCVLRGIRVRRAENCVTVSCSYHTVSGSEASPQARIAAVLREAYETATCVGAVLPETEWLLLDDTTRFSVSAIPVGNDYPLEGDAQ